MSAKNLQETCLLGSQVRSELVASLKVQTFALNLVVKFWVHKWLGRLTLNPSQTTQPLIRILPRKDTTTSRPISSFLSSCDSLRPVVFKSLYTWCNLVKQVLQKTPTASGCFVGLKPCLTLTLEHKGLSHWAKLQLKVTEIYFWVFKMCQDSMPRVLAGRENRKQWLENVFKKVPSNRVRLDTEAALAGIEAGYEAVFIDTRLIHFSINLLLCRVQWQVTGQGNKFELSRKGITHREQQKEVFWPRIWRWRLLCEKRQTWTTSQDFFLANCFSNFLPEITRE